VNRKTSLEKLVFWFLIFLLPSQLAYHFWPDYSFIFGIRIDYLAPSIYLTDLLVLFLVVVSRTKVKVSYLLAIGLFACLNVYFSVSPSVSFWKWIKVYELIFFAKYISDNKHFLRIKTFVRIFCLSLIIISVIGIIQFLVGGTIGGVFWLMGERSFGIFTPGIALQEIQGREFLRAYSVFSHPNSLAGYLGVSVLLLSVNTGFKKSRLFPVTILISLVAFVLTFSTSAFLAAGAVGLIALSFRMKNFLYLTLPVTERLELIRTSKELILKNFFTGTGLNTFVYSTRLMQPVHNIFLLTLTEAGVAAFLIVVFLFYRIFKHFPLIAIFVLATGMLDHYWFTLQQNMLLFSLVAGLSFEGKKS